MNGLLDILDTPEALLARDLGKGLLSVAPVSGEIMSAQDAVDEYKKGNYWMSLLAAAGAVPILGTALRLGSKGFDAVSDLARMYPDQMGAIGAFHGTPHTVDKFSMDKIGTGEGAQAYGHGLYFADSPSTAKFYQEKLSKRGMMPPKADFFENLDTGEVYQKSRGFYEKGDGVRISKEEYQQAFRDAQDAWNKPEYTGNIYSVNLDVEPENLLDWDAPLADMPEPIQGNLRRLLASVDEAAPMSPKMQEIIDGDDPLGLLDIADDFDPYGHLTGADIYHKFSDIKHLGGQPVGAEMASGALLKEGIKGIQYFDGANRGFPYKVQAMYKGKPYGEPIPAVKNQVDSLVKEYKEKGFDVDVKEGSRNYVIFDDSLIGTPKPYK